MKKDQWRGEPFVSEDTSLTTVELHAWADSRRLSAADKEQLLAVGRARDDAREEIADALEAAAQRGAVVKDGASILVVVCNVMHGLIGKQSLVRDYKAVFARESAAKERLREALSQLLGAGHVLKGSTNILDHWAEDPEFVSKEKRQAEVKRIKDACDEWHTRLVAALEKLK